MDLKELRRKRAGIAEQARAINKTADDAQRVKTPEERTSYDALIAQGEELSREIESRERLDALAGVISSAGGEGNSLLGEVESSRHKYSILKAIRQCMKHEKVDGIEAEVSQELCQRRGRGVKGNGFVVPYDLPVNLRASAVGRMAFGNAEQRTGVLNTTTGTGGIPTILDTTYIDLLRNMLVARQAGARVMADMQGLFAIPRQNQAGTAYWVAESGTVTASNQTVDQVAFSPKTCGAFTDISRRLAEQINTDAEMFVREDLAAVVARAIDLAAFHGTGSSNQPTGIIATSNIGVVAGGTNGAAPTWGNIVGLESLVAVANALMGSLCYVTNATTRGTLKQTAKIGSTFPVFLWDVNSGNTPVNGYPCLVSNQISSALTKGTGTGLSAIFFGNFADLIMAFWSGMDVIVDPYTGSSSGTVRIVTLQDVDINVRHPESFSVFKDVITL